MHEGLGPKLGPWKLSQVHLALLPEHIDPAAYWRDHYTPLVTLPRDQIRYVFSCSPVHRAALAACPSPGRTIDAGCGMGVLGLMNDDPQRQIVGVDEVDSLLRLAGALVPGKQFLKGGLDALPVEDSSFDQYVAVSAIECTTLGLPSSLDEAMRVLKPGGELFAACLRLPLDARMMDQGPIESTLGSIRIQRLHSLPKERPERAIAIYYSSRELKKAAREAGFENVRVSRSDLIGGFAYSRLAGLGPRPRVLEALSSFIQAGVSGAGDQRHQEIMSMVTEQGQVFERFAPLMGLLRHGFSYWNILRARKPR